MIFKDLGLYCKWLERNFSCEVMIPTLPVIIRLDGNSFHNWTRGLDRPFCEPLVELMIETTKFLCQETNAVVGFTQSDEISLILHSHTRDSAIYNDGKKQKILSKLTGRCVSFFNDMRKQYLPNHDKVANFDCRVYQAPSLEDACAQLLWRENDATKNSIQMLAQSLFSHKSLQNLNGNQLQDKMMLEKSVNWNDLPNKYKRGSYIKRVKVLKPFSVDELELLPARHEAKKNPDLIVERSIFERINYPPFSKIKNRMDVIFNNAEPILGDL